jgi:hypothetical protein
MIFNPENQEWITGPLNNEQFDVGPDSKIAACFLAGGAGFRLRLYVQNKDNTIQEYGYADRHPLPSEPLPENTVPRRVRARWVRMANLGEALPGTNIACASFYISETHIRYVHFSFLSLFSLCLSSLLSLESTISSHPTICADANTPKAKAGIPTHSPGSLSHPTPP